METLYDIKRKTRGMIAPLIGLGMVAYFGYHALNGERGVAAWWGLKKEIARADQVSDQLAAQKAELEHKVALLSAETLDPDMLEEQARKVLGLGRPDERIVFDKGL